MESLQLEYISTQALSQQRNLQVLEMLSKSNQMMIYHSKHFFFAYLPKFSQIPEQKQ
jgi:hypothetical protein